ncbi:MAG: helix-turn-helix domain-containing protein [Caldilineaceae bacterium]|nr:helix-turn-helix domain-containing protein [Caldilineaceae bacterium]MDE0339317.1 helix-turn-helix domain-containing protein [Caldilineaceae bacterium]
MYRDATTLEEIYRLALPQGSRILFGEELLNRPVSWACSLRPSPPAFPNLEGEELALIDVDDLHRFNPQMRLDRVVNSLHQARISAIGVLGEIPRDAVAVAEQNRIPLIALPDSEPLLSVERTVIRLIVDRGGYLATKAADLQRELTQIELDGGGMGMMAELLASFSEQPVLFLKDGGTPIAFAGLEELTEQHKRRVLASMPSHTTLRSWLAAEFGTEPAENTELTGILPIDSKHRYREMVVSPVIVAERVEGYCLLLRSNSVASEEISTVERLAVLQGAGAAALAWSREQAVGAVEEKMRTVFLDELLATEIADEDAWIQRGNTLGFDLTRPHTAWLIQAEGIQDWPNALHQYLAAKQDQILLSVRAEDTLLFWPCDNPKSGREFKSVATGLVEHFTSTFRRASLVVGIGRPAASVREWLRSLDQARESWRMGCSWQASPVTYFGDLGLYQLLTGLGGSGEANRFFRKTVEPLITHDEEHNAELVETLEAFFACHGNLSQTAALLHIHRNTLTYRLQRISSITQIDLNDADARFSLQLGLKLRPVMQNRLQ